MAQGREVARKSKRVNTVTGRGGFASNAALWVSVPSFRVLLVMAAARISSTNVTAVVALGR